MDFLKMKKTKQQLEQDILQLQKDKENLQQKLRDKEIDFEAKLNAALDFKNNSTSISNSDYQHYLELQRSTINYIERTNALQESNTALINTIANLNGGVLKDLSETIVNLTSKKTNY